MDLINIQVKHKIFGNGTIISKDDSYVTIKFSNEEKRFKYPDAFDGYLFVRDPNINNRIKKDIETMKRNQLEKEKRIAEEKEKNLLTKEKKKRVGKSKFYPRESIAFKCNYCDGGQSDEQIGYGGVCSDEIIKNNIEIEKRTWCSAEDCDCSKYLAGNITRSKLDKMYNEGQYPCYESQMLKEWRAFAGVVQTGKRKGQPMKLHKVQSNSLCVLTTRNPDSKEEDRFIFGVFLVDETYEGDDKEEGYVSTKSKYKLKLSREQAEKMLFWNYHANQNSPEATLWSSGLHRYFGDEQAVQILQDITRLKKGTEDEKLAKEFLLHFCKINNVDIDSLPEKDGALQKR